MATGSLLRARLRVLAESGCKPLGNAEIVDVLTLLANDPHNKQIVFVLYAGKKITISIENTFLEESADEVVINHITHAIVDFGKRG
jgi:hypothetical protein